MDRLYNYNDYDRLTLYVKNNKTKLIIDSYQKLGWELISSISNHKYSDIMDLTFIRPHFIKNKDRLQLLQINMESTLNKIGKLEKKKHSKSIIVGLYLVIFGLSSIVISIFQLYNWGRILDKILGFSIMFIGLLSLFLLYFLIPNIYKKEKINFENKYIILKSNLESTYKDIKHSKEENYEI